MDGMKIRIYNIKLMGYEGKRLYVLWRRPNHIYN